jgi:hypothetical protein
MAGTMEFGRMTAVLAAGDTVRSASVLTGLAMTVSGIGFKLAVVPSTARLAYSITCASSWRCTRLLLGWKTGQP